MTVAEDNNWSLETHLERGKAAIAVIDSAVAGKTIEPLVCFHFAPVDFDVGMEWGDEADYCKLARPLFEALPFPLNVDYVGGTSGIEAWETTMPSVAWLHERIAPLIELAGRADLIFQGWSFEPRQPRDFSFVSCGPDLNVVNRSTPEGQASFDALVADAKVEK